MQRDFKALIESARKGDNTAYTDLFTATSEQMLGRARAMLKNEEDALDILQESYAYAFRSLDQLEHPEYFTTWLYRIVTNRAKNFLVRYKPNLFEVQMMIDDEGQEYEVEDEDISFRPDESVDYNETKRIVRQIVDELPDDQRACILLYYFQDLKVSQIAEQLDLSENTVKSRLSYARKKMKIRAEEYERTGTQLHGISFFPFLRWMFQEETHTAAQESMGKLSAQLLSNMAASSAAPEVSAAASSSATPSASAASVTAASTASTASIASASAAEGMALPNAASVAATVAGKHGAHHMMNGKTLAGVLAAFVALYGVATLYSNKTEILPENDVLPGTSITEAVPESAKTDFSIPSDTHDTTTAVEPGNLETAPIDNFAPTSEGREKDGPSISKEEGNDDFIAEDESEVIDSGANEEGNFADFIIGDTSKKGAGDLEIEFEYKEDFDPSNLGGSSENDQNIDFIFDGKPVTPDNDDIPVFDFGNDTENIYEATGDETSGPNGSEFVFVEDDTEYVYEVTDDYIEPTFESTTKGVAEPEFEYSYVEESAEVSTAE